MEFSDYTGPSGAFVAAGERVVPLLSAEGLAALGHSAMLMALGPGEKARRYERGMQQALAQAHAIDAASRP